MKEPEGSAPPQPARFEATRWTVVLDAALSRVHRMPAGSRSKGISV
jgi:hypothetical protein